MGLMPGYKSSELGIIPESWGCESVQNAAAKSSNAIVGGPFGSDLVAADYVDSGIPVIRGKNLSGRTVSGDFVFVAPEKANSLRPNIARPGDLVFTQRGTLGQVAVVPDDGFEQYLVSQSQMKVTLDRSRHDPSFVRHFFASEVGQKLIIASAIQTGVPHTNLGILRAYRFPAPPLQEQRAIASRLDDADLLIDRLAQLIAKKRDLKQAAMQQLLTGQTRLPGFAGEWAVARLGDHVRFLKHGVYARAELTPNGTVKYLHYGDIHVSTNVRLEPSSAIMPFLPEQRARHLDRLLDGDVVFVDASENLDGVGKSMEIAGVQGCELVAGLHTIAARFDKTLLADGFKAYLQFCPAFREGLRRLAAGTKVYATTRAHIASIELPLPSPDEQTAIAGVLSDMDAELAALEARLEKTRAVKQAVMQALLTGRIRLV